MKENAVRRLIFAALLTAVGVLLPQVFHLAAGPAAGRMFLPMHIPVLLSGFLCGPLYAALVGLVTPALSSLITGMPAAAILPYMMFELVAYGAMSGLLYRVPVLRDRPWGVYPALLGAMVAGRAAYALLLFVTAAWFGVTNAGAASVLTSISTGIAGIVIQIVVIPPIVYALKKGGFIHGTAEAGEGTAEK